MKLLLHSFLGLALIFNLSAQADKAKTESKKETTEHKDMKIVSYLIGADIGSNMKNAELKIEVERFIEGFQAAVSGKKIEFSDEDFSKNSRDSIYYVRAIQEPSPVVNSGNLRCTYNDKGECIKVNICYGDSRTDKDDDCLALSEERAWSSPIYVNFIET